MSASTFDVAVIGGGIAGLTAAYHAAFGGVSVANFKDSNDLPGGLVANVGVLDGFPSVGPVAGMELATKLAESGASLGVRSVDARVDAIEKMGSGFKLTAKGGSWSARQVIIASGARLRTLGIPGADKFKDKGVMQCAWCNAGLYRDREVVVLGGGDAALQEALHLADYAAGVTIVSHRDQLRAQPYYVAKASKIDKIQFRWNMEPLDILGDDKVEVIRLRDNGDGSVEELHCAGIFVFIGLDANAELIGNLAAKDNRGFIVTDDKYETAEPGLFAVGAVRSRYPGRLTNAVGEASAAAITASSRVAA